MSTQISHDAHDLEKQPFLSVVIPCFNNRSTLGDCLRAVLDQSYPSACYEVIVADNGSNDGSRDYVEQHFPQVQLLHVIESGSAHARNAGLAIAKGDLIISTDADCISDHRWIEFLVQAFLQAGPRTAAVGGTVLPFSQRTLVERSRQAWVTQPTEASDLPFRYTAASNTIFSAQALREVGGFDGAAGHDDTDLGIRLSAAGYGIRYTDQATISHRNPVTLRELFHHRRKYALRNYLMAEKYPELFGHPAGASTRRRLLRETLRRLASDMVKLPLSFLRSTPGKPRGWPIVDATIALGNYRGFIQASNAARKKSA